MLKDLRVLMGLDSGTPTLDEAMLENLVSRLESALCESASSEAKDVSAKAMAASKQAQFGTGTNRPNHPALHQDAFAWHTRARDLHATAALEHPTGSKERAHHSSMGTLHDKFLALHGRHVGQAADVA